MRQSKLFPNKGLKEIPKDEQTVNAQLLMRGGFIDKTMAGVYTILPLGFRVMKKIENIIREEMNAVDGQEMSMPVMHPKELWQKTGRWESFDVLFKLKGSGDKELALGPTHEELITPLTQKHIFSYKDLPLAVYQIQTKFRNELRSRSGLLRGREFLMKDLYSFHTDEKDLDKYYEQVAAAYEKIWQRLGIGEQTVRTFASGGAFSKYSQEFQTLAEDGEDSIYLCVKCKLGVNKEIIKDVDHKCPECGNAKMEEQNSIEVGNIFKLMTKFSEAFGFNFVDEKNQEHLVIMASYGIGLGRVMATVVETSHDKAGIIWPQALSPYQAHLLNISKDNKKADEVYKALQKGGFDVLYDDREISAGEKFAEADLLGISLRLVISDKTGDKIELKPRDRKETKLISLADLKKQLKSH